MGTILKSPDALRDLQGIWAYVAQDNPKAADRLVRSIDEKLTLLADLPFIGRAREDVAPSLRSLPVGKYVLFYRPAAGGIELVRVLLGARRLPSDLGAG